MHVVAENIREHRQRGHAFLDPGAAAVQNADHRAAVAQGEFLDFDDFLAVDLAERSAVYREILAVDGDQTTVHGAVAGDQTITERLLLLHPEGAGAVHGQGVELDEGIGVHQKLDAVARGVLAPGVLFLDRFRT